MQQTPPQTAVFLTLRHGLGIERLPQWQNTGLVLPAFDLSRRLEVREEILITRADEHAGLYGRLALFLILVGLAGKPDDVRRLGERSATRLGIDDSGRTPYALYRPISALFITERSHGCRRTRS